MAAAVASRAKLPASLALPDVVGLALETRWTTSPWLVDAPSDDDEDDNDDDNDDDREDDDHRQSDG